MKLYKLPNAPAGERWHSSKTGLKEIVEIELPKEGRAGMAQFLNGNEREVAPYSAPLRCVETEDRMELDELQQAEARAVAAARNTNVVRERQLTTDAIVAFILDDATVAQAEAVFAALGTRFKEQVNATR